jgi:hypothetical protein
MFHFFCWEKQKKKTLKIRVFLEQTLEELEAEGVELIITSIEVNLYCII